MPRICQPDQVEQGSQKERSQLNWLHQLYIPDVSKLGSTIIQSQETRKARHVCFRLSALGRLTYLLRGRRHGYCPPLP